jgi:hypothetical protein
MLMSKEQLDMVNGMDEDPLRQWTPEPPPEGGYEVILIQPYGEGAEDFADMVQEMSRHDPDMARITAAGCGMDLKKEDMVSVQLGGLVHDGHGNLILERREHLKEVQDEMRKERSDELKRAIDDLIAGLKGKSKVNSEEDSEDE